MSPTGFPELPLWHQRRLGDGCGCWIVLDGRRLDHGRQQPRPKVGFLIVSDLLCQPRQAAQLKNQLVGFRQDTDGPGVHHLLPCPRFADADALTIAAPGRALGRADFRCLPDHVGNPALDPVIADRERHEHVAIFHDAVLVAVHFINLVERLDRQHAFDPEAGNLRHLLGKVRHLAQAVKLIAQDQQPVILLTAPAVGVRYSPRSWRT